MVIDQLWGPMINLVGDGSYLAWTIGDWFLVKWGNLAMFVLIAVLFLAGMFIDLPEKKKRST
jgi:hypothetical protein